MTNTDRLELRIQQSGLKKNYIAQVLGITQKTLANKIANRCEFKASEIDALCKLLGITDPVEKEAIFFAAIVA